MQSGHIPWLNSASEWSLIYSSIWRQYPLSSRIFLHEAQIGKKPLRVFTSFFNNSNLVMSLLLPRMPRLFPFSSWTCRQTWLIHRTFPDLVMIRNPTGSTSPFIVTPWWCVSHFVKSSGWIIFFNKSLFDKNLLGSIQWLTHRRGKQRGRFRQYLANIPNRRRNLQLSGIFVRFWPAPLAIQ